MKQKKREAMRQVRAVQAILRQWDPIGVEPGRLAPADEYDSYAHHVVSMVSQRCSIEELSAYLTRARTLMMGVEADARRDEDAAREILLALRGEEE